MSETPSIVALIPARGGSIRIKNKNIRKLGGYPLIAYTIKAAKESGIFDDIIVSTDNEEIAEIARDYNAPIPFMRPAEYAGERSPDIEWVLFTLKTLRDQGKNYDAFSILRPTSPFRTSETIKKAWTRFLNSNGADSIRAIGKCREHPGKMWLIRQDRLLPLLPFGPESRPWHSSQYQSLPEVYIQNASLEICWTRVVFKTGTIAGSTIAPYITEGYEGFDINYPEDWEIAEKMIETGRVETDLK